MRSAFVRAAGRGAALALVATVTIAVVVTQRDGKETAPSVRPTAAAWAGLVPDHRGDIEVGERMLVVLNEPSLADRVRLAGGLASDARERAWTRQALAAQQLFVRRMVLQGAGIRPEYRFARVLNGFSAALDPRAVALLERAPEVEGIYPVRAAYPAGGGNPGIPASAFDARAGRVPVVRLPGFDGRGVTIALVDTGVDRLQPYLRGRVADEVDVLGGDDGVAPDAPPARSDEALRHGTGLAGILVGSGGPGGLHGVAPRATIVPIRVAGWQRDTDGEWRIAARTDQLVAGLERAVDPNGDGDAHDAARIALVGTVEPLAGFATGPLARAAAGAAAVDTLVVTPAGNDGPAGPGFGVVSAPGGAPAALTVGAADTRGREERARVALRAGLNVLSDSVVPLVGAMPPERPLDLELGAPRLSAPAATPREQAESLAPEDFLDAAGYSRVAGRAALVPAGTRAAAVARYAADAGAAAVVLYGSAAPPGALGLDERVPVPVFELPTRSARRLAEEAADGADVRVSIVGMSGASLGGGIRVAAFSSSGLAFDGRVKPELVAPGVGILTSVPGQYEDGTGRFGTLNGSSAAGAIVAGAAALLAQARPDLDAAALKGVVVGSATRLRASETAQGAGLLDVQRAAASELALEPATLAFGRAARPGWARTRRLLVHNVSSRTVRVRLAVRQQLGGAAQPRIEVRPTRLILRPGGVARIRVVASLAEPPTGGPAAEGALVLTPVTGRPLRVPFAIPFGPPRVTLVSNVALRPTDFEPSEARPAVLSLEAGEIRSNGGRDELEPIDRLDIELLAGEEEHVVGVIARLRNALPGVYSFAITGYDPGGQPLTPGDYTLRITAHPAGGGPATRRSVRFTIH
jgi:subtilisin family serine protease